MPTRWGTCIRCKWPCYDIASRCDTWNWFQFPLPALNRNIMAGCWWNLMFISISRPADPSWWVCNMVFLIRHTSSWLFMPLVQLCWVHTEWNPLKNSAIYKCLCMCCGSSFEIVCEVTPFTRPCLSACGKRPLASHQISVHECVCGIYCIVYVSPTCCMDSTVDSSCCRLDSSSSHLQNKAQRWVSYC